MAAWVWRNFPLREQVGHEVGNATAERGPERLATHQGGRHLARRAIGSREELEGGGPPSSPEHNRGSRRCLLAFRWACRVRRRGGVILAFLHFSHGGSWSGCTRTRVVCVSAVFSMRTSFHGMGMGGRCVCNGMGCQHRHSPVAGARGNRMRNTTEAPAPRIGYGAEGGRRPTPLFC